MKTYFNVVCGKYEKQIPVDDMCISLLSTHNRQKNPVRSSHKDTIVSHTPLQAEICSKFCRTVKKSVDTQ